MHDQVGLPDVENDQLIVIVLVRHACLPLSVANELRARHLVGAGSRSSWPTRRAGPRAPDNSDGSGQFAGCLGPPSNLGGTVPTPRSWLAKKRSRAEKPSGPLPSTSIRSASLLSATSQPHSAHGAVGKPARLSR